MKMLHVLESTLDKKRSIQNTFIMLNTSVCGCQELDIFYSN